ncbi:MAG: ATP-binding cassette domain-containing protein, partial [Pseudomonadota bacterium]
MLGHKEPRQAASAMEYVVNARQLRKHYDGVAVVDGIELQVERGECFGLLGPNGAGKTTTLRMLLGMTGADAGDLRVLGHAIP